MIPNPNYNSTYIVTIKAYQLSSEQPYSLVISGDLDYAHFIKRDASTSKSSSIFTTFPLYVTISILIVLISIFVLCLYYVVKYHNDVVKGNKFEHETFYSLRESNLRSFSERYDQFNENELPSIPNNKAGRKSRRSQRESHISRGSNGSVLYRHDLQDMYPQVNSITPSVSPYLIQPPRQSARNSSTSFSRSHPSHHSSTRSFNSKTCSKDLLLHYSSVVQNASQSRARSSSKRSPGQSTSHSLSPPRTANNISSSASISSTDAVHIMHPTR